MRGALSHMDTLKGYTCVWLYITCLNKVLLKSNSKNWVSRLFENQKNELGVNMLADLVLSKLIII